jgi:hypothetical protein
MPSDPTVDDSGPPDGRLGWRGLGLILALQAASLAVATWPEVLKYQTGVPCNEDVYQHLWVMRWYKTCLLEGRSVFFCPELQHPVGAPLGYFSPLHLQSLLFVPLSLLTDNDAFCWNVLCATGMLLTGVGTSLLAWHFLRDRACAAFAGVPAMLCYPMMIHSICHLELVYVGGFPLFLVAWVRFVDRPGPRRLTAAVLGYLLVAMCAAYYMVFAVFPAALYLVWSLSRAGRRGARPWLLARAPWLLGMVLLTVPGLLALYSGNLWAVANGFPVRRTWDDFAIFYAPLWGYVVPTFWHRLSALLPSDPYAKAGPVSLIGSSYLGVVTVGLLAYAVTHRVGLRCRSYVWSAFALTVALSLGATWKVGSRELPLPAAWLWTIFPPLRMTRDPSRFNLFAAVLAGVLAAAGLKHLLARLPGRGARAALFGGLVALVIADLGIVILPRSPLPKLPGCYAFLKQHDPKAAILEIPDTFAGTPLGSLCTYWQSLHRLTTSVGYSGHDNRTQFQRVHINSPFFVNYLTDPRFLDNPGRASLGLIADVDLKEYLWLYLTVNRFDYVVLHRPERQPGVASPPAQLERVRLLLRDCQVYEDTNSVVYARSRLGRPSRPVPSVVAWSAPNVWGSRLNCVLPRAARVAVYNPDPGQSVRLTLDVATVSVPLSVRLRAGSEELARWEVVPGNYQTWTSPPLRLPTGVQELTIESEPRDKTTGDRPPRRDEPDKPYRLRLARLRVDSASEATPIADRDRNSDPSRDTKVR